MSDPVSKKGDDAIQRIQKQLIANIWLNIAAIIFAGIAISYSVFVYASETESAANIVKILEQQGNLSHSARERIINAIIRNENSTIPQINHTLVAINQTLDEIKNTAPQSNFTAQKKAIENIEHIIKTVDEIKIQLGNNTK